MRKLIISSIVLLILFGVGTIILKNHLSYRNLRVDFGSNTSGVNALFLQGDSEIKNIDTDGFVRIKKGMYTIQTTGSEDYEQLNFSYEVTEDSQELFINPSFTKEKLASLLSEQEALIHTTVKNTVNLGSSYKVNKGELYIHGEWYGTTIIPNLSDEELRLNYVDVFRVILQKQGDNWRLVNQTPQLVVTKHDHPEVPVQVLSGVNRQYGEADTPF